MLSIFKKMFGKAEPKVPAPRVVAVSQAAAPEPMQPRPQVEMAHLSLAAIVSKFPEDLRRNVARVPDPSVTVALPLATIHKQLPSGSVKMSLASLYRQAPAGVFTAARVEEKRMVEVPLSEVFRHVKPQALSRKNEQRRVELPEGYELFGDKENPYTIAPTVPDEEEAASMPAPRAAVTPPSALRPQAQPRVAAAPAAAHAAVARPTPPSIKTPAGVSAAPASDEQPPVLVSLSALCGAWPEPFCSEAAALDGAQVALPVSAVSAGLAKGRVTFTWGQIRAWLSPSPEYGTNGSESAELILPLKVLAPLFLTQARPNARRRAVDMDESIPALFSGGNAAPAAPAPAPEPEVAPAPEPPALSVIAPSPELKLAPPAAEPEQSIEEEAPAEPVAEEPVVEAAPEAPTAVSAPESIAEPEPVAAPESIAAPEALAEVLAPEPIAEPETIAEPEAPAAVSAPEPVAEPEPVAAPALQLAPEPAVQPAAAPAAEQSPAVQSVGELFGNPSKSHWSPPDLVRGTMGLPGVVGAVVALQEGLVVAAELPETMKGDTIAAFLPQMFARLNNYAGEMKLGGITDLLLTADGAPFQVFKLGEVYFAVLGKAGERLPGDNLRLIAQELAGSNLQ